MTPTYDVLINARSNRGHKIDTQLVELFANNDIQLRRHYYANGGKQLFEQIKKIRRSRPDVLIIAGGDGTISTVIRKLSDTSITFGIIPTGTTNNFARTIALPPEIKDQVRTIAHGYRTPIDLGFVNSDGFVNVVGVGMSAVIAQNVSDRLKRSVGRLAYTLEGIKRVRSFRPFIATITDPDSELEINYETRQIIIANGRFHAGTVIADDSGVTTGELVVFPLGGRSLFSFAVATASFYLFRRQSGRRSSFIHSTHMTMTTSRKIEYERDGEPSSAKTFELTVKKKAIYVMTDTKHI